MVSGVHFAGKKMKKLRIGVVGVGHIGRNHARLYAELPEVEFTVIHDTDRTRAEQIGGEFGATAVGSLAEFVEQIDAASIATPTNTHFEIARGLLEQGKHLLIEKPI